MKGKVRQNGEREIKIATFLVVERKWTNSGHGSQFYERLFLLARPNVSDVRFNEYFFIIYDEIFYENLLRKSRRILFYLEERGETFICRRGVSYVNLDITLKKNYFCIFFTYTLSKPEIPEEERLL